jgi:hypothetical protein
MQSLIYLDWIPYNVPYIIERLVDRLTGNKLIPIFLLYKKENRTSVIFEWKYHTSGFLGRETHETAWFFLAGKRTRPQVKWVSLAKKTTSVIFPLKKHTSAVFCLSHGTK